MSYTHDLALAAHAPLPFEALEGRSILITGATGLIGGTLLEVLLARTDLHARFYALGRNAQRLRARLGEAWNDPRLTFISHNIEQPLEGDTPFDYIIHAASGASPKAFAEDPVGILRANIFATDHLLAYGLRHGLRRFLYVSSGEVYGEGDGRVFTEEYSGYVDPMQPRSCYPQAKRAAETLCAAYRQQTGIDTLVARPCHTYGPHFTESDTRVYAEFIRAARRGDDIVMKSRGEQYRSWVYVVDCATALLTILLKGEAGQAYNIADDGSNITIRELAEMIARMGATRVRMELPTEAEKAVFNPVKKSVFSAQRLKGLGWQPLHDMETSIRHSI